MRIPQRSLKLILLAIAVAELTSAFESSMIYSALATLYRLYGDPATVGWLVTGFLLVSAGAAAVCGRLGDLFGRKRLLIIVLAAAIIGSLISALSTDLIWVIFGRCIQGLTAAILPLGYGIIREAAPSEKMPLYVGLVSGTYLVGAAVGYLFGGVIVDYFHWKVLFYCSSGLAVVALLLVTLFLPPAAASLQQPSDDHDILGGVLFVPAVGGIMLAITKGPVWGWLDSRLLGLLSLSLILFVFWVLREARHHNPLIDVKLFKNRQIALANMALGVIAFGAMPLHMIVLPLMQQPTSTAIGLGVSASVAGSLKSLANLIGSCGGPTSGYIASRHGARNSLIVGAILTLVPVTALAFCHSSIGLVAALVCAAVVGMSIIFSAVPNLILEVAPRDRSSEATGLSIVTRSIMLAIGSQAIASILASHTVIDPVSASKFPSATAYSMAFGLVVIATGCCLITALALPATKNQRDDANKVRAV
ncbi:MFS transporter [Pseudomonas sp. NFX224]|uniref:MFS transporter n=1 Tax=Pseudomonas sp. NFX224 TaxID=3402862 RepID=UPI003AFA9467